MATTNGGDNTNSHSNSNGDTVAAASVAEAMAPRPSLDSAATITPISQLSPDLADQPTRAVRGEVTIVWPYNSVKRSLAFLLAESDTRLRRAKGQIRVQLYGPSAAAVAEAGLGGGDELLLGLDGATWATDESALRTPGVRVEWQLEYKGKLVLEAKIGEAQETHNIRVDQAEADETATDNSLAGGVDGVRNGITDVPTAADLTPRPLSPVLPDRLLPSSPASQFLSSTYPDEYASPAFIKRARISFGSLFEPGFDIFEEDGGIRGRGRKRTRFGRPSNAWRYSSQSVSPEPEKEPSEAGEDKDKDITTTSPVASTPVARPPMTDEACQTVDNPPNKPPVAALTTTTTTTTEVQTEAQEPPSSPPPALFATPTPAPRQPPAPAQDPTAAMSVSEPEETPKQHSNIFSSALFGSAPAVTTAPPNPFMAPPTSAPSADAMGFVPDDSLFNDQVRFSFGHGSHDHHENHVHHSFGHPSAPEPSHDEEPPFGSQYHYPDPPSQHIIATTHDAAAVEDAHTLLHATNYGVSMPLETHSGHIDAHHDGTSHSSQHSEHALVWPIDSQSLDAAHASGHVAVDAPAVHRSSVVDDGVFEEQPTDIPREVDEYGYNGRRYQNEEEEDMVAMVDIDDDGTPVDLISDNDAEGEYEDADEEEDADGEQEFDRNAGDQEGEGGEGEEEDEEEGVGLDDDEGAEAVDESGIASDAGDDYDMRNYADVDDDMEGNETPEQQQVGAVAFGDEGEEDEDDEDEDEDEEGEDGEAPEDNDRIGAGVRQGVEYDDEEDEEGEYGSEDEEGEFGYDEGDSYQSQHAVRHRNPAYDGDPRAAYDQEGGYDSNPDYEDEEEEDELEEEEDEPSHGSSRRPGMQPAQPTQAVVIDLLSDSDDDDEAPSAPTPAPILQPPARPSPPAAVQASPPVSSPSHARTKSTETPIPPPIVPGFSSQPPPRPTSQSGPKRETPIPPPTLPVSIAPPGRNRMSPPPAASTDEEDESDDEELDEDEDDAHSHDADDEEDDEMDEDDEDGESQSFVRPEGEGFRPINGNLSDSEEESDEADDSDGEKENQPPRPLLPVLPTPAQGSMEHQTQTTEAATENEEPEQDEVEKAMEAALDAELAAEAEAEAAAEAQAEAEAEAAELVVPDEPPAEEAPEVLVQSVETQDDDVNPEAEDQRIVDETPAVVETVEADDADEVDNSSKAEEPPAAKLQEKEEESEPRTEAQISEVEQDDDYVMVGKAEEEEAVASEEKRPVPAEIVVEKTEPAQAVEAEDIPNMDSASSILPPPPAQHLDPAQQLAAQALFAGGVLSFGNDPTPPATQSFAHSHMPSQDFLAIENRPEPNIIVSSSPLASPVSAIFDPTPQTSESHEPAQAQVPTEVPAEGQAEETQKAPSTVVLPTIELPDREEITVQVPPGPDFVTEEDVDDLIQSQLMSEMEMSFAFDQHILDYGQGAGGDSDVEMELAPPVAVEQDQQQEQGQAGRPIVEEVGDDTMIVEEESVVVVALPAPAQALEAKAETENAKAAASAPAQEQQPTAATEELLLDGGDAMEVDAATDVDMHSVVSEQHAAEDVQATQPTQVMEDVMPDAVVGAAAAADSAAVSHQPAATEAPPTSAARPGQSTPQPQRQTDGADDELDDSPDTKNSSSNIASRQHRMSLRSTSIRASMSPRAADKMITDSQEDVTALPPGSPDPSIMLARTARRGKQPASQHSQDAAAALLQPSPDIVAAKAAAPEKEALSAPAAAASATTRPSASPRATRSTTPNTRSAAAAAAAAAALGRQAAEAPDEVSVALARSGGKRARLEHVPEAEHEEEAHEQKKGGAAPKRQKKEPKSSSAGGTTPAPAQDLKTMRATIPDCVPLRSLRSHLRRIVDAVAVAVQDAPTPQRTKTRQYAMTFAVTDQSLEPASGGPEAQTPVIVEVHLFRAHKSSLPAFHAGDGLLLRQFEVVALPGKGFGLASTEESSYAVVGDHGTSGIGAGGETQVNGPPVEDMEDEHTYLSLLRAWYHMALDDGARAKLVAAADEFAAMETSGSQAA